MPATPLPPSGEMPAGPKTCDASGMIEIHRMFRRGFGEAPSLVHAVPEGDQTWAGAVATQLETLSLGLHAHHEAEDERLWDALDERAPSCAGHVARMKEQHAALLVHLTALDAALPPGARRRSKRMPRPWSRRWTASMPPWPCTCPTRRPTSCR